MAVRRIVEYPNPILREKTRLVDKVTPRIHNLIKDLLDTMSHYPGCIGLAAPQIGELDRVAVVNVSKNEPGKQQLVLINPQILEKIGEKFLREGCLSVQNLTANVKRADGVVVQWLDLKGDHIVYSASGIEAICIQHEMDHLDGALFIDRVLNAQTDIFRRKRYLH